MFTMFREGGPESPLSIRRILATYFAVLAAPLAIIAIPYKVALAFIPSGVCVCACLVLLFFTTWADVATVVKAALKKEG